MTCLEAGCVTARANVGAENLREMRKEPLVILKLGLYIGITWKVFGGETPHCPVSPRLTKLES